jgi:broad specificity phosphatase PhoE
VAALLLVKHSIPAVEPASPATGWPLSEDGRERCRPLAERLRPYAPEAIVASTETKAAETAALTGEELGLSVALDDRLREHDRSDVGWLSQAAFTSAVERAFAEPEAAVFGQESLAEARSRFAAAADGRLEQTAGTLVLVSHGTVISAFAAERARIDGLTLWRRLGLPSLVVLGRPAFELVEVVESIP